MRRTLKFVGLFGLLMLALIAIWLLLPNSRPTPTPLIGAVPPAFHDCSLERYHPVRISDFFTPDTVIKSAKPKYPPGVYSHGGGRVGVKILINLETGHVERACAFSGPHELWLESERAASEWSFKTPAVSPRASKYALDFIVFDPRPLK